MPLIDLRPGQSTGGGTGGGSLASSNNFKIYKKTISALDIANQSITLPESPSPALVSLKVDTAHNGFMQDNEYTLSGSTISWGTAPSSLLRDHLEVGEVIEILYQYVI